MSLLPKNELKSVPEFKIPHFDKIVHFSMYFILNFLFLSRSKITTHKLKIQKIILFSSICFAIGLGMELLQQLPAINRTADVYDQLVNTLGAISAIFVVLLFSKKIKQIS